MEIVADGIEQLGLGSPLHHMDDSLFPRRLAGELRVAVGIVEIFGDGGAFGDVGTVIKLQDRQHTGWILFQKIRLLVLGGD